MKYSIVIPTYNKCNEFLKPCLESIFKYTDLNDIELIISANGCTDNTKEYLDSIVKHFPSLQLIVCWDTEPLGYPKAVNNGVRQTTSDKIILLNNDCVLLPQTKNDWVNILQSAFDKNPNCGISCNTKIFSEAANSEFAIFYCVMIDRKVFDTIGLLNEEYGIGMGEDIEFCIKAKESGFEIIQSMVSTYNINHGFWVNAFPIQHFAEGTMHDSTLVNDYNEHYNKNLLLLAKKFNPDWYNRYNSDTFEHSNIKYSIVIPTYNHCDDLLIPCINSIIDNTYLTNVEIIIIANGCTDNTYEYLDSLYTTFAYKGVCGNIKIIKEDNSLGYTKATNIGISIASGEYIILMNNDVQLLSQNKSHWLDIMEEPFKHYDDVGITGPVKFKWTCGDNVYQAMAFWLVMIKKQVFDCIGFLDEIYNPGFGDDKDFCIKAINYGYGLVDTLANDNFPVYHIGSSTFIVDSKYRNMIIDRNNSILYNKYGKNDKLHKIMNTEKLIKYSIIIPTYNHCDDLLKPCIESIFKNTDMTNVELIISANGCTDGTKEYLESLSNKFNALGFESHLCIVWNNDALGYSRACNMGINTASGEKIILLNNDAVLLDYLPKNSWLDMLEKPFYDDTTCGLSAPSKRYCEYIDGDFLIFYCVMIDRKVFDKIGLLNEEYGIGAGEDTEFCLEAVKNGFSIHQCDIQEWSFEVNMPTGRFPIFHPGEGTVHDAKLVSNWTETFIRNSLLLCQKYKPSWHTNKTHNDKKIGVITSIYNGITDIIQCIDTVKSQNINNVIHYIYNDGSTDGLNLIFDIFYNDPNVQFFDEKQNHGLSYGRNFALSKALTDNCEIIAFLDVDDHWDNNHLMDSIQYLNNNDVIYSFPKITDKEKNALFPSWEVPAEFDGKYLRISNFIWVSSVVAKSTCFKEIKFNEELTCYEDWDMWLQLYERNFTFYNKKLQTITYIYNSNTNWGNPSEQYNKMIKNHINPPKTIVIGFSFNETKMMPYFLEHYSNISDKIILIEGDPDYQYGYLKNIYDFDVDVIESETLDDFQLMELRNYYWLKFKNDYDYIIIVDIDEFLDITSNDIKQLKQNGVTLPVIKGYQMVSMDFPVNLGEVTNGFEDAVHMNKQVIFSSLIQHINYYIGCHTCEPIGNIVKSDMAYKLYHYKYIGFEEFIEKSKKAALRLSKNNKDHMWGIHYEKDSNIKKEEFELLINKCSDVKLETNIRPKTSALECLNWLKNKNQESVFLFDEVIKDNVYNVSEQNIKDKCVIDIGANMGMFTIFSAFIGAKIVIAVEPVSTTINILHENIRESGLNNIKTFNNAVTNISGQEINISLYDESGHNGMYNIVEKYETVKTITLGELLSYTNGKDVYLKLDCEGAEYDIIMNATKEEMSQISCIGVEIHAEFHPIYKGREILAQKLLDFGFIHRECRQMGMWYDNGTVFVPGPLTIEYWSK